MNEKYVMNMAAGRILNMKNSVMVENLFQRKSLTPGWRKIIFNTSSASEMKDVLTLMRVMLIFLHGNRNDQRAMDGLLVQYMTPKMARFVYG